MRINLQCPYADKDQAKSLGARWDPEKKTWYVVDPQDLAPFAKWLGKNALDKREHLPGKKKKVRAKKNRVSRFAGDSNGFVTIGLQYVETQSTSDLPPWDEGDDDPDVIRMLRSIAHA